MTILARSVRSVGSVIAAIALLVSCSNNNPGAAQTTIPTPTTTTAVSSLPPTANSTPKSTGPNDEQLIATAEAALRENNEPVTNDREPVVKRSDTIADVAFPTRFDLPPRIGGEAHVFLDPNTGTVIRITHTR